jgi:hypothetical protein
LYELEVLNDELLQVNGCRFRIVLQVKSQTQEVLEDKLGVEALLALDLLEYPALEHVQDGRVVKISEELMPFLSLDVI